MAKTANEPPKYPEIGARLTQFIKDSGEPNPRQFALKAGLAPQLIHNLASGYSMPGGETLLALARSFRKFDATWLLTGVDSQLPPQVPSKLEPLQPPPTPGDITAERLRGNMSALASTSLEDKATITYLREQLAKAEAELARTREQMVLDQGRSHEREIELIKTIGNRKLDASADAADGYEAPYMEVSHVNHEYAQQVAAAYHMPAVATWMEFVASR